MAETLRYVDGVLASFPDNSQGLIDAVSMRDYAASYLTGRGFIIEATAFNLPITDGAWTAINPLLPSPTASLQTLWVFDGNNYATQAYKDTTITIPAGYSKLFSVVAVLDLTKAAGGADQYQFQFTKNGVGLGLAETVDFPAAGKHTVTLLAFDVVDLSLSDTYGVQAQGVGTADDLTVEYFNMQPSDSILLNGP